MPRSKRIILLLLPVALVAGGVWWWLRGPENPLERWCAGELRRIAGDLIEPRLEFSSLQLELPVAVTLTDVSLTSEREVIVSIASLRLEFRERPRRGHPLVIEAATFDDAQVRLVGRPGGGLKGFSGFMKSTTGRRYEDGGSSRPSDFLSIRQVELHGGMIEWSLFGREKPMRLDLVETDLAVSPDVDRPGWYRCKANVDRPPVVHLTWDGEISVDTGDLSFDDLTLRVDLAGDKYASLTPSIQEYLRRYSIVGDLTAHATGHLPLGNPPAANLAIDASLLNAGAAVGAYQFPIESAEMKATFRQLRFSCDPLSVKAFGGQIDLAGWLSVADARPFTLNVKARDVLIQDMLRPVAGKVPRFAGNIDLRLGVDGEQRDLGATLVGRGTLKIADGLLINVPAVGALADDLAIDRHKEAGDDRGEIDITLAHDRATIDKVLIQSKWIAAHGKGDVHFDGRLDMNVNAGVVEKAEALIGELGDVLAALTDRLLPYEISGTWSKPIVTPEPLGIPVGKMRNKKD